MSLIKLSKIININNLKSDVFESYNYFVLVQPIKQQYSEKYIRNYCDFVNITYHIDNVKHNYNFDDIISFFVLFRHNIKEYGIIMDIFRFYINDIVNEYIVNLYKHLLLIFDVQYVDFASNDIIGLDLCDLCNNTRTTSDIYIENFLYIHNSESADYIRHTVVLMQNKSRDIDKKTNSNILSLIRKTKHIYKILKFTEIKDIINVVNFIQFYVDININILKYGLQHNIENINKLKNCLPCKTSFRYYQNGKKIII